LSGDLIPALDVINFIYEEYKKRGLNYSHIVNIPPTSVFCTKEIIEDAINLSRLNPKKIIIPVKEFNVPIDSSYYLDTKTNKLIPYSLENFSSNTQNFRRNVYDAGVLAIIPSELLSFRKNNKLISDSLLGLKINDQVIDIDDPQDWQIAENVYKASKL
jgi:CMP-N-acetylneuraminic acid synthetase